MRGTLVFDVETRLLASDVASLHAEEFAGASPWTRPDMFGFGVGVIVEAETGVAMRYGPGDGEAADMLAELAQAERVVSYNGAAFDLRVLAGAVGDKPYAEKCLEAIARNHVDLRAVVADKLAELGGKERLRSGGLDALARANRIGGKTGSGASAPELYRQGRIEELLSYCEADVRITARLYERALRTGRLRVEPYTERDGQRVQLPAVELDVADALIRGEA